MSIDPKLFGFVAAVLIIFVNWLKQTISVEKCIYGAVCTGRVLHQGSAVLVGNVLVEARLQSID